MHAILIDHPGPEGRLRLAELPPPRPGPGEVCLRVAYAGVNRADLFQKQGSYPAPEGASPIPGLEVSGYVDTLGSGVSLPLGTPVCALTAGGGYAEYVCVPADQLLPLPEGWDLAQAACLPEAMLTVWLAMIDVGKAQPGDTVLFQGGTSGLGSVGIPMLAQFGLHVLATVRTPDKARLCEEWGATAAFPYDAPDLPAQLRYLAPDGIAAALDMLGGEHLATALSALRHGGRLVSLAFLNGARPGLSLAPLLTKNLTWSGVTLRSQLPARKAVLAAELRAQVWPKLAKNPWRPAIDAVFSLTEAETAQNRMQERLHLGKILLKVGA